MNVSTSPSEVRTLSAEERSRLEEQVAQLARAAFVLRPIAWLSPLLVGAVVYVLLGEVLQSDLVPYFVGAVVLVDGMLMLSVSRSVTGKLERLRTDLLMGQVEDYIVGDVRNPAGLRRSLGNLDLTSLQQACREYLERRRENSQSKGFASVAAAFRLLGEIGALRVSLLPRSRYVVKVDEVA